MTLLAHFALLADYNRWMNEKVYAAAARLPATERTAARGAFFGSIFGTLNHLIVADLVWLRRFAQHPRAPALLEELAEWPVPKALGEPVFADFEALAAQRPRLDALISRWIEALSEADLAIPLEYRNMQGVPARRAFSSVLLHLFNHQTHHRGQVTTLLTQAGEDVGVTDLLVRIPSDLPA
jgi:uncharacterized damage-inducible protein DinB